MPYSYVAAEDAERIERGENADAILHVEIGPGPLCIDSKFNLACKREIKDGDVRPGSWQRRGAAEGDTQSPAMERTLDV